MDEILINLDRPIGQEQSDQFELFREKYNQLIENWESLESLGVRLTGWVGLSGAGKIDSTGSGIDIHRMKGIYSDFRLFFLNCEPTNFYKVCGLVKGHAHQAPAVRCLDAVKGQWKRADEPKGFLGCRSEEVVNVVFNGDVFHTKDPSTRAEYERLERRVGERLIMQIVVTVIREKMKAISNLVWVIQPLSVESQIVRIPRFFA